jgi:hypothetical protein
MKDYVCPKYALEAMVRGEVEGPSGAWTTTL